MKKLIARNDNGSIRTECYLVTENNGSVLEKIFFYDSEKNLNLIDKEIRTQRKAGTVCKNIPKIFWTKKEPNENKYTVRMEFISGNTLREEIDKGLDKKRAVSYLKQLCITLDQLYMRAGIVHKDLKPENIIISKGKAYLIDFGSSIENKTIDTGTRMYQSPEQRSPKYSKKSIGCATDVFSLGLILYEMVNRERLFLTDKEIEDGKWESAQVLAPSFSPLSNSIFNEMIAVEPIKRCNYNRILQIAAIEK